MLYVTIWIKKQNGGFKITTHTQKDTMYTWKLVGLCIQMLGIRSNVTVVNLTQTMKKKENYNYDMYAMNE